VPGRPVEGDDPRELEVRAALVIALLRRRELERRLRDVQAEILELAKRLPPDSPLRDL
jgi:hypothetical protein